IKYQEQTVVPGNHHAISRQVQARCHASGRMPARNLPDRMEPASETHANTRAPFHDLPRNSGCGHGVRRCEVELPRSGTTGKVPVDGGDRDLVLRARHARTRVDARAARWLDERRAHVGENPVVTLLLAVLEHFARPALDEAAYVLRYVLVPLQRFPEDTGVHVHVLLLASRARAGVRNVDRDLV